jgi:hypothetical protein
MSGSIQILSGLPTTDLLHDDHKQYQISVLFVVARQKID